MRFSATWQQIEDYRRAYISYMSIEDKKIEKNEGGHFRTATLNYLTTYMNKISIATSKDDPNPHCYDISIDQWRSIRLAAQEYLTTYCRSRGTNSQYSHYTQLLAHLDTFALAVAVEEAMEDTVSSSAG